MSEAGKITIIANNIKGNAKGQVRYDAKKISNTSGGTFTQNGKDKGVAYGKAEERKSPVKVAQAITKVKKIELITTLEDGSANDKSGGIQKGMIFGKTYEFRVKSYTEKEPQNKSEIKWMLKYHSLSKNKWQEINLKARGDVLKLFVNEKDMCGRFVYIKAYINDSEAEGQLKIWMHNRFRWFDRMLVQEQAEERGKEPWRIDQGNTSLCGMASLFYLLAKKDGKGYIKLTKELLRTGEYKYNDYIIMPHENAQIMYSANPYKDKDYPKLPEVDWLTLACVRSKESSFFGKLLYKGKKGQDAEAINWPTLMKPLSKTLLGYTDVKMDYYKVNKSYLRDFFGSDEKLRILEKDINADFKNGYEICLLIDGSMVAYQAEANYSLDDFSEYHWVVYEGGLKMLNAKKIIETDYDEVTDIEFNVFTWGSLRNDTIDSKKSKKMPKIKLTKNQFRSNYYGYLKLK
ncbi:MAG: hypothetical protein ABI426_06965 [Flavobacterium sp.]